jgi:hypothetical protein
MAKIARIERQLDFRPPAAAVLLLAVVFQPLNSMP